MRKSVYLLEDDKKNAPFNLFKLISFVVLLLSIYVLCGCRTQEVVTNNNEHHTEVSNTTTEREHISNDSVIGINSDSAYMKLWLECDSLGNVYLADIEKKDGERTEMEIEIGNLVKQLSERNKGNGNKGLELMIDCAADSLTIVVNKQKEIIRELESRCDSISSVSQSKEFVPYVPDTYKNYKKGFWWLLCIDLLVVVLVVLFFVGKKTPWGKAALLAIKCAIKL